MYVGPIAMLRALRSKLVASRGRIPAVTPSTPEPAAAARAGADLKEARERLGLTLDDLAASLRIRLSYLQALEEGRITQLPGNAYTLAFVRSYAIALGLDPREMVRRFKTEAAAFGQRTELLFPIPMPDRALPAGAVVLLGVVLVIGAYIGWYRLSGDGRLPAETVTAIPERLAPLAEQVFPSVAASGLQNAKSRPAAVGVPAETANPPTMLADAKPPARPTDPTLPVMAISPTSAAAAQLTGLSVDGVPDVGRTVAALGGSSGTLVGDPARILLRATADAWLLVRDRGGVVLLNRTIRSGESWPVPPRPDLVLTTGNAGGTDIVIDGTTAPSLGASGTVRRDIALDPEQLLDRKWINLGVPQLPRLHQ